MTPEVAARLKEITVDPKTVVLAKKVDAAAVGAPKPAVRPRRGNRRATRARSRSAARRCPMSITQHDQGRGRRPGWSPSTAKTADGRRGRRHDARQGTLVSRKRIDQAGPVDDRRSRSRAARPPAPSPWAASPSRCRWTSAAPSSPTASGGGDVARRACRWPTATRRPTATSTCSKQKVALKQVKVVGTEDVTVPAGHVPGLEGRDQLGRGRARHARRSGSRRTRRKVVKTTATLPSMGGAVVTSELQP